jgi:hypothetical protein
MKRGPYKTKPRDNLTRPAISMTDTMRDAVQEIADKNGLTFSECARRLIMKGILAHYVPIEGKQNDEQI